MGLIQAAQAKPAGVPQMAPPAAQPAQINPTDLLMQKAQTKAAQYANSRGLLNSSMAAGAGAAATAEVAQQASQFDKTFGLEQQRVNNQADQFGQSLAFQKDQFGQSLGLDRDRLQAQKDQFGQTLAFQKDQFGQSLGLDKDRLQAQIDQFGQSLGLDQKRLDQQASQFGQSLDLDKMRVDLAGKAFGQNNFSNYAAAMQNIINNSNMGEDDKINAYQTLGAIYLGEAMTDANGNPMFGTDLSNAKNVLINGATPNGGNPTTGGPFPSKPPMGGLIMRALQGRAR